MEIKKVAYENFRNIAEAEVAFTPGTNVLWGNNAQGKTNILEGIYFFARGKSFRASSDRETVRFGGVTARFWEAEKPHEAETDAWEPETVGGVIISSGTISGPQAADVATLAWTDGGLNFRLHGTVDQENLLHVAESLRIK